ncbi:hypothetical protein GCM10022631_20170 [Deinococcus rubellus]|uniref:Uncharacterized protein n=1 Tax=Deinococcus rubellus TaxID=1889240 RepID=A0ABY5YH10_9DEIO|nr:hypothetical protein [Deinococcus rubellus]UWX64400.1 hypothetical protein N0D28_01635 [Deinococcus rubellus]
MTPLETDAVLRRVSGVERVLLNAGESITFGDLRLQIYGYDNSVDGLERPECFRGEADVRLLTRHTHGGQIRLFGLTVARGRRWHTGARREPDNGVFYISRGLGSPPEVLCADLIPR